MKHCVPVGLATPGHVDAFSNALLGISEVEPNTSAYLRARSSDWGAAYGDVAVIFGEVDEQLASLLARLVSDGIAATRYTDEALRILRNKRNGQYLVVEIDPFANLTMGRSFWLDGRLDESRAWLARATQLSPSYAKSVYAEAWTDTLSGRGDDGETHVQNAIALSPMDPMLYAMLATRSLSHTVRGDFEAAAAWGERAVVSPGAHAMIHVIAAFTHSLNGDRERAAHWARRVRERFPTLTQQDFFASFPFAGQDVRSRISGEMAALGF
jgi:hypothetical protein